MKLTETDLRDVIFHCEEMSFIPVGIYSRIGELHPEFTAVQLRDAFVYAIAEFMRQGRLKFLGEGWVKNGIGPEAPFMFGDEEFKPTDTVVNGLRQPDDSSPDGVVTLIRSKWPPELEPAFNVNLSGFDRLWFEKWWFEWA